MKTLREIFGDSVGPAQYAALVGTAVGMVAAVVVLGFLLHQSHQEIARLGGETTTSEGPELSSVITELKRQIAHEEEHAAENNEADLFVLKDIDLELSFTVKQERSVEGKLEPKLIAVTSTTSVSSERVQKMTFHLIPVQPEISAGSAHDGLSSEPPPPKAAQAAPLRRNGR